MAYCVRASNFVGSMDFGPLRKFWEGITGGQVIVHKNEVGHQVFDMVPPPDFRDEEETREFAEAMAKDFESRGYQAEVIEITQN